eukprot:437183-Pleurochrysis_carterae.AAC.1
MGAVIDPQLRTVYMPCTLQVLRSDPQGVQLMHHYPNIEDDPGEEAWLPKEKWSFDRVFHDVTRW